MGSYSRLTIGNMEIDWGKNEFTNNHSCLFLKDEKKEVHYHYAYGEIENKDAYCATLSKILPRIELLGYSLEKSKNIFDAFAAEFPYGNNQITFEKLLSILQSVDVDDKQLGNFEEDHPDYYDFGEMVSKCIFSKGSLKEFREISEADKDLGQFLENIDPYIILRLLACNSNNLTKEVCWRYMDLVDGGWEQEDEIYVELSSESKYLIITEGSSDSTIIKFAFEWLRPDISHFFDYIDMENNYPFTGAGNLVNFYNGLCKISIKRNVLFIFDNDSIGNASSDKCIENSSCIKKITLPTCDYFKKFNCIGPTGITCEDINGKAVSIELFLDHDYETKDKPVIRWTSFVEKKNSYHGELLNKVKYTKLFCKAYNERNAQYNTERLEILLDSIIDSVSR